MAGVILGGLGLVLGAIAFVQIYKVNKSVAEHEAKIATIDSVKATADQAQASANQALDKNKILFESVQKAINEQISPALISLREDVTKIQEASKKPVPVAGKAGAGGPVVPGPGEYVIKPKDTFAVIGRAHGVSAQDIAAVNPGVDSSKLKVGQKIKLPAKAK